MNSWLLMAKGRGITKNWEDTVQQWYNWLHEKKKKCEKVEEKRRVEEHQKLVGQLSPSAEGGADFLHIIAKPAAWRGVLLVLGEF